MPFIVGTSGWDYAHWRGIFYPPRMPDRLAFYAGRFPTVEVNGTFYRLPEKRVFRDWERRTRADFVFAVKASRFLTHLRRLDSPRAPVRRLLSRVDGLGAKLGPILLQLPPGFPADLDRLEETLAAFGDRRVAVEFRDESWFSRDVRQLLERYDAAFCIADRNSRLVTPAWRTADWGYVRFHGGTGTPPGGYGRTSLRARAGLLAGMFEPERDVFVYFNNDGHGCALRDATRFARLVDGTAAVRRQAA